MNYALTDDAMRKEQQRKQKKKVSKLCTKLIFQWDDEKIMGNLRAIIGCIIIEW